LKFNNALEADEICIPSHNRSHLSLP